MWLLDYHNSLPFVLVAVLLTLRELVKQHGNAGLPELDPVVDMGIKDEIVLKAIKKVSAMKTKVENNAVYQVRGFSQPTATASNSQ